VTEMIAHTWLHDYLKRLKKHFPQTLVELSVDISINLSKELQDRSLDLALQNAPFNRRMGAEVALGSYPLIWVAAPGIALPDKKVTIEHLANHPVMTHARYTQPHEEVTQHFASRRDLHPRLVQSNNVSASLQMCVNGMGIATLPEAMVLKELDRGELCRIDYGWVPSSLDFFARFDAEKSPSLVQRAADLAAEVSNEFLKQLYSPSKAK
ncbi:MAG: substrate-binding domain-containing protein, partial [Granulosicoccaceae bacterium]